MPPAAMAEAGSTIMAAGSRSSCTAVTPLGTTLARFLLQLNRRQLVQATVWLLHGRSLLATAVGRLEAVAGTRRCLPGQTHR
jgi:hypothetical protein